MPGAIFLRDGFLFENRGGKIVAWCRRVFWRHRDGLPRVSKVDNSEVEGRSYKMQLH